MKVFVVLAVIAAVAFAADTTVQVGISGSNVFSPANFSINSGDTVTWSKGNTAQHTVTETNQTGGTWPVPNYSGLGFTTITNAMLDAATDPTFTFTLPGSTAVDFYYYCSIHGDQGMWGTITVNPSTPPPSTPPITPSLSPSSAAPNLSPSLPPCEVTCECIKPSKVPPSDKPTKTFRPDPTKIPDELFHYMTITFPTAGVSDMTCPILASVTGQTEWFFCGDASEEKYAPETKGDKYTVQTFAQAGSDPGQLSATEAETARDTVEASTECNNECKVSLKTDQKARCSAASIVASVALLAAALALLL